MANSVTLQVASRSGTGKGAARSLRRAGQVPAVIYGHNRDAEAVAVDAPALARLLTTLESVSTIVDVTIDDRAPVKALIRELQRDPVKPANILHVDLYEVRADEAVTVSVPVHCVGTADGVRNFGGVLDQVLYALEIECLPADIPAHIDLDVTALTVGHSIYVKDVKVANAKIKNDPSLPIVSVIAPRTEEGAAGEAPSAEPELIRKPKPEAEA